MCKDRAFKKDVQLNPQQIHILCRPQIAYIMPPTTKTQKVNKELAKTPTENLSLMQLPKLTKNTKCHTELIN